MILNGLNIKKSVKMKKDQIQKIMISVNKIFSDLEYILENLKHYGILYP